ncbi:hypothetical protein DSECCO2_490650 [anaerobic digester metagenome]
MTEAVVDVLEAVDIHLHDGEEVVFAHPGAVHGLLDAVQAQGAVGQVGQGVVEGAVLQAFLGVLAGRGVLEDGRDLTFLGTEGHDGEVPAQEGGEAVEADGFAAHGGFAQDVYPEGLDPVGQLAQAVADDLLGRHFEEAGEGRVDVEHDEVHGPPRVVQDHLVQGEAVEHGVEQQPVLLLALLQGLGGGVLVEGDLDGHVQVARLGGLDDVAEGLGDLRAAQGLLVVVAREEDDGDLGAFEDLLGGLDAVHAALEEDVHEDEGRFLPGHGLDGLLAGSDDALDRVAELLQTLLHVEGDDDVVLDKEDGGLAGRRFCRGIRFLARWRGLHGKSGILGCEQCRDAYLCLLR